MVFLRAAGHRVYAPSLSGLGERSHLLNPAIDLDTHVEDVLGVIKWERLENITLVGHSYGGFVVTGVADRANERIGSIIYLDAFLPKDGEALIDLLPIERAAFIRKAADEEGEGWYLPLTTSPQQHVTDPGEAALLTKLCVPHPFATFTQILNLSGNHLMIAKKAYVLASGHRPSPFAKFAEEAHKLGWPVEQLATHHFTMLSMPRETADILIRYAA
jgi:pimeloyl-ACP methyl ester carboxylesterase